MDAFGLLKTTANAYMRSDNVKEGTRKAIANLAAPFMGLDINAQLFIELLTGENMDTGSKVWTSKETPEDIFLAMANHVLETVTPGTIKSAQRIADPQRDTRVELLATFGGVRLVDQAYDNSMKYKVWDYDAQMREASTTFSRHFNKGGEQEREQYADMYFRELRNNTDHLHRCYWAAKRGGATDLDLMVAMKQANMTDKEIGAVVTNQYLTLIGDRQFERAISVYLNNPNWRLPALRKNQTTTP